MGYGAVDAFRRLRRCIGVTSVDDDACAKLGEKRGDCQPDTACATDHDGTTAGQRCANRRP